MNKGIETALTNLAETKLAKVRNVGMDLIATMHMIKSKDSKQVWTCDCSACQYLKSSPRVLQSVLKTVYETR